METKTGSVVILPVSTEVGTPRLGVEHISGEIKISGWDRAEIELRSPDTNDDYDLEDLFNIRQDGNVVEVSALHRGGDLQRRFKHGRSWDIGGIIQVAVGVGIGISADLEIKVPYSTDIRVRTASGDIEVSDVDGKLSIATASGDVELTSFVGNALVQTASGDVEISDFAGRLGLRSMSGDLEVRADELLELSVGTASGDVEISGKLVAEGSYELSSVSGDVTLSVPSESSLTAEVRTISGDIECNLTHEATRRGKREQRLVINGGDGPEVRIHTTSGDVEIAKWRGSPEPRSSRGAVTERLGKIGQEELARVEGGAEIGGQTVRLETPQPQQSVEQTILDAIERGEMTVEEGIQKLGEMKK